MQQIRLPRVATQSSRRLLTQGEEGGKIRKESPSRWSGIMRDNSYHDLVGDGLIEGEMMLGIGAIELMKSD